MFFLKLFTDLRTGNHTAGGDVAQTGAVSEVDTIVWTEELLNTWDQNSFTEKPDEAEDTGPINTGLNLISEEVRDVDGEGLKPNQEHERRGTLTFLAVLLSSEHCWVSIHKRSPKIQLSSVDKVILCVD